ncbi:MAG: FAD:protein FMN transferase [Gemmatimonadota bacterium]
MRSPDRPDGGAPSRREFVALGIGAFVVAAVPAWARPRTRLVRRRIPLMGTIAEIGVVARSRARAEEAIDRALAELRRVEALMSRFRADSDVGKANRLALRRPVVVSPETGLVLGAALRWAVATDGSFDPCLLGAQRLWNVEARHRPPPDAEVARFAGRGLYRHLELGDAPGGTAVRFRAPDVGLDLGGIAKGYGVDRAVRALRDFGVRSGLVNVGGDLFALGASEDGDPWEVGIRSPADPWALAGRVRVTDRAVATSGDYERYFDYGGRRYHHILDPATGAPRRAPRHSLTVVADACMEADAAGTALFGLGRPQAEALLGRLDPGASLVAA